LIYWRFQGDELARPKGLNPLDFSLRSKFKSCSSDLSNPSGVLTPESPNKKRLPEKTGNPFVVFWLTGIELIRPQDLSPSGFSLRSKFKSCSSDLSNPSGVLTPESPNKKRLPEKTGNPFVIFLAVLRGLTSPFHGLGPAGFSLRSKSKSAVLQICRTPVLALRALSNKKL